MSSFQTAPAQGCHVGFYTRLVDEDEPRERTFIVSDKHSLRLAAHEGLATVAPCLASHLDVSAFFLRRQQRFFSKRPVNEPLRFCAIG